MLKGSLNTAVDYLIEDVSSNKITSKRKAVLEPTYVIKKAGQTNSATHPTSFDRVSMMARRLEFRNVG
jgi:hypothetical protein